MEALFLQVLNMSITASYVIAAILLLRLLLRRAPKKYSYFLWSAAAFRLCCPVSFSSVFSIFSLKFFDMKAAPNQGGTVLQYIPERIGTMANPRVTVGISSASNAISSSLPEATPMYSTNPMQIWIAAGAFFWCAGMALLLLYSIISCLRLHRLTCNAVLLTENVYQSERVCSPFILGFFRPRIYIPFHLNEVSLGYVLAHERYHLKRLDHIVKLLAFLLLTVHWFNPLCHLAFALMSRDMEMSCDEKVLASEPNIRKAYSTTLLSFAANRRFPSPGPLAFGETDVKARIKNVLRWKRPRLRMTAAAALLCAFALAACTANPRAASSDAPDSGQPDFAGETDENASEDPLDTQKYILPQIQACYAQAVQLGNVDTDAVVSDLFESILSSPAVSSNPQDYISEHSIDYRELTYYGDYTLRYIFRQFLAGGQTGLKGSLMRIVMDELIGGESLRLYAATGQEYFDAWLLEIQNTEREQGMNYMREYMPKAALLLDMME